LAVFQRIRASRVEAQVNTCGRVLEPHRAARLERRAESLRRQLEDASAVISQQRQPLADPLEAASRRAHEAYVQATRQQLAGAQAPGPRPFGSDSRGGAAVRSDPVACEACAAVGASPEESFLIHHSDADGRPVSAPGVDELELAEFARETVCRAGLLAAASSGGQQGHGEAWSSLAAGAAICRCRYAPL
jgi:hypothetical protein